MEWKIGQTKDLIKTPIWTVRSTQKTDPSGTNREYVSIKSPDWVCAIVRLGSNADKYVMVEQFRHGINHLTIEFPCGMVDGEETAMQALMRELKEEIGIIDANLVSIKQLYTACPNPAFMDNRMTCFYAVVDNLGTNKPDDDEFLETKILSRAEVEKIVAADDYNVMMKHAWLCVKDLL